MNPGRLFRRAFSPWESVGVRWSALLAALLVFGRARAGSEALVRMAAYLLALAAHETAHWLLAGRLFPGLPRRPTPGALGGPAPIPPSPPLAATLWNLLPAAGGAVVGIWLLRGRPHGDFIRAFASFLLLVSAANFLPFRPLDAYHLLSAGVRKTRLYWKHPAWGETLGTAGGALMAAAAFWDPLGAGEVVLTGGMAVFLENLQGLIARKRAARAPVSPTGFPSPKRIPPEDKKRLDDILARVAEVGIDGINAKDREFLEEISRRYRR